MAQPCLLILPFWERRRNIWFSSSYSWHADAWLRRTLATQVIGLQVYDVSESSNFQAGGDAISGDSTWLHLSLKVIFRLPGHHSVKVQEVMATCGAGCDCTYALATLSLDKEDANRCPGGIHLEPFLNHPICGLLLGIPWEAWYTVYHCFGWWIRMYKIER